MADEADTNPYINSQGNGADTAPQIALISQYVKDLSFENPNAPAVYQWPDQPQIDVQFNIGADRVGEEVMEISLKIDVKATIDGSVGNAGGQGDASTTSLRTGRSPQ